MPRINQTIIDSVFYLYQTVEDARAGINPRGTGFLVSYKNWKSGLYQTSYYGVTNWHVALRGNSVVRINCRDGTSSIFDFSPDEWEFIAGGPDIAAIPLELDPKIHSCNCIDTSLFLNDHQLRNLSVGEDVFMLGLFVDHAGKTTNNPQARFGNISMLASDSSKIQQKTGYEGQSYIVDTHSRPGFSGSPVFVYRTPLNDFGSDQELKGEAKSQSLGYQLSRRGDRSGREGSSFDVSIKVSNTLFALLGIHWGQFAERWEIYDDPSSNTKDENNSLVKNGGYVEGVSGMTLVIPAHEIMKLLKLQKFAELRNMKIHKALKSQASHIVEESATDKINVADEPDNSHREDFNNLLDAAVKRKQ